MDGGLLRESWGEAAKAQRREGLRGALVCNFYIIKPWYQTDLSENLDFATVQFRPSYLTSLNLSFLSVRGGQSCEHEM